MLARIQPKHLLVVLAALTFGSAGLLVWAPWQGEGSDGKASGQTQRSTRYTARANHDDARSGTHKSARRNGQLAQANSTSTGPNDMAGASEQTGPDPDRAAAKHVSRPRDATNAILRRSGATPAGRATQGNGSMSLRGILSNTSLTTRQRVAAIESLRNSGSLTEEDLANALDYLNTTTAPEGMSPGQHHWIVDELITTLRVDGADNEALSRALADVYANKEQHMVVRDYALQHLGHIRLEGGDQQAIDTTLQAATAEKQGTIAGTALLALNQAKDLTSTGAIALAVASDPSTDIRSRITALQVAGRQGNTEALPFAAKTAADTTQPVSLRMSAIATLADLGASDQQPLLQKLSRSRDIRLRNAAKEALTKLSGD